MLTVVLVVLLIGLGIGILLLFLNLHKLQERFAPVIDAEREARRVRESTQREAQHWRTEIEQSKVQAQTLKDQYHRNHELFERLQREIAAVQENLEDISFGLYTPHFTFETSEHYKQAMEKAYQTKRSLIRDGKAAECLVPWTVNNSKREGEKMVKQFTKVMLRAFNGEVDAAVAKVSWNNITRMEERIQKAYEAINALGSVNQIRILPAYRNLCLDELRLTFELEEKKQAEKEEQRRIREEMREEERAQKEFERTQREAVQEQERYEKALAAAKADVAKATGEALFRAEEKVADLEAKLSEAQAKMQRAMSMAQMTKMGHVYVISNIGSFGEDVFKIGMTRRLEPQERVQELGDASVPFSFDVHAMIFSEDAPALERAFHRQFAEKSVNLVNLRKEFFKVGLDEIAAFAERQGVTVEFTMLAEAKQYRESLTLRDRAMAGEQILLPEAFDSLPRELVFAED